MGNGPMTKPDIRDNYSTRAIFFLGICRLWGIKPVVLGDEHPESSQELRTMLNTWDL
jgi:hypothetical protein